MKMDEVGTRRLAVRPIVANNADPGGYIAEANRRRRQRAAQYRIRFMIVMVCFWMSFLMR